MGTIDNDLTEQGTIYEIENRNENEKMTNEGSIILRSYPAITKQPKASENLSINFEWRSLMGFIWSDQKFFEFTFK